MRLKLKTLPVKIFLIYLIITFIMYVFSPLGWEKKHLNEMITFNVVVWIAIYYGFMLGVNKPIEGQNRRFHVGGKYWVVFSIITLIATYLDLQVIFQKSNIGLQDFFISQNSFSLGDSYNNRMDQFAFGGITSIIYMIVVPISYTYVYINIFRWGQCRVYHKIITILYVLMHIMGYVSIGTNKGIFDFVLSIPIIAIASRGQLSTIYRVPIKYVLMLVCVGLGAFMFFGAAISSRSQGRVFTHNPINSAAIDYNAPIFKALPEQYHNAYVSFDFYLTHAYNNMDVAIDLPFKPCYGLGSSPALLQQVQKLGVGKDIPSRTYEARVSNYYGVSVGLWWYTAYVAFANDVSFLGVPLVILLLAYLFGVLWRDVVQIKNMSAVPLLYLMIICFFYLNANNQIFGKSQLIPFCILFFVWYLSKKRIVL